MKSCYTFSLKTLLRSFKTYVYFAVTLLAAGGFLTYVNFSNGYSVIEYSLEFLEIALLLTLPLITADMFASDRQSGFEKTLLAMGVTTSSLFFGKLLAVVTVFLIPQLPLCLTPVIFDIFGIVNYASAYASVFAYLLLGCSLICACALISVTARTVLASYVASFITLVAFYFLGVFAGAVSQTRQLSLLVLTAILVAASIVVYVFTKSSLIFCGSFCITEGLMILLYFAAPKFFAGALAKFLKLLSPCAALNDIIYGPFDLTAMLHIVLFGAVLVILSLVQLKRRKYE